MQHPDGWLADYHDHELPAWRCRQIESHIASCPACREELASLRLLSRALTTYRMPDTMVGAERFRSQVVLRLPRRNASDGQRTGWLWWAVPVSLVCVLVALLALSGLSQMTVWVVSIVRWSGQGGSLAALISSGTGAEGTLGDLLSSFLLPLVGIAWQMLLCAVLIMVFVPYVGWVGVLVRAHRRSDVLKGGTRGPL